MFKYYLDGKKYGLELFRYQYEVNESISKKKGLLIGKAADRIDCNIK